MTGTTGEMGLPVLARPDMFAFGVDFRSLG
jgi:hypothetical protein